MAEREIRVIIQKARQRWRLRHVAVAHRIGVVPTAESSVEIAISSTHRKEALAAVQFAIDELKAQVRTRAHTSAPQLMADSQNLTIISSSVASGISHTNAATRPKGMHPRDGSPFSRACRSRFGKRRSTTALQPNGRRTRRAPRLPSQASRLVRVAGVRCCRRRRCLARGWRSRWRSRRGGGSARKVGADPYCGLALGLCLGVPSRLWPLPLRSSGVSSSHEPRARVSGSQQLRGTRQCITSCGFQILVHRPSTHAPSHVLAGIQ